MKEKEMEQVNAGLASLRTENEEYDRCPMCDNPTPIDSSGRCKCTNCGHSWRAGSH